MLLKKIFICQKSGSGGEGQTGVRFFGFGRIDEGEQNIYRTSQNKRYFYELYNSALDICSTAAVPNLRYVRNLKGYASLFSV